MASEPAAQAQPSILFFVRDRANLVTLLGLALGMVGVAAAMAHALAFAAACGVGAMVCDTFDGPIARRSLNRTDYHRAYGIQLDSLADIVCSTALPAAVLIALLRHSGLAVAAAVGTLLVLSGAVRLAHFNLFGRVAGATVGLPVAYTPAVVAAALLVPGDTHAGVLLAVLLAVVAVLQVLPIRVPDLDGVPMLVFMTVTVAVSFVLLAWQR